MERDEITLLNHFKTDCIILFYIQTRSHLASTSRPDSELRRTIIDLEKMKYSYTFIHESDIKFSCNRSYAGYNASFYVILWVGEIQ